MASIAGLRERLPLIVFIFLVILVAMVLGFACACLTDHPMQAIERALSQVQTTAIASGDPWSPVVLAAIGFAIFATASRRPLARPSPAGLQRFLF
jgi:hypothetical protein